MKVPARWNFSKVNSMVNVVLEGTMGLRGADRPLDLII